MPRRKGNNVQPRFSFVSPEIAFIAGRACHTRNLAVRRHAAYWGGPMRHLRSPKRGANEAQYAPGLADIRREQITTSLSSSNSEQRNRLLVVYRHGTQSVFEFTDRSTEHFLEQMTSASLASLPYPPPRVVDSEALLLDDLSYAESPLSGLFGQTLLARFAIPHQWMSSSFMAGCMLLTTAQSMAVSGSGKRADLLELKAQVLRSVSRRLAQSSEALNLESMAIITLLCSPIVCLLSQDLPSGLSFGKYVEASAQGIDVCCSEAASAAKIATYERKVHWRHLQGFSPEVGILDQQAEQMELFTYLYRSTRISITLDDDVPPKVASVGGADTRSTRNASIWRNPTPLPWVSPLTAGGFDDYSTSNVETATNALVKLTQDWLATFLDNCDQEVDLTPDLWLQRLWLQQSLARFVGPWRSVSTAEEAVYACCWWATTVMLKADRFHVSLASAAEDTRMQPRLVRCLRMTDLSNLWGTRRGLLFWVVSVCHLATADRCLPLLTTALYAHFAHEMASDEALYQVGMAQLERLRRFEKLCQWNSDPQQPADL